jgi:hypothetical protein
MEKAQKLIQGRSKMLSITRIGIKLKLVFYLMHTHVGQHIQQYINLIDALSERALKSVKKSI